MCNWVWISIRRSPSSSASCSGLRILLGDDMLGNIETIVTNDGNTWTHKCDGRGIYMRGSVSDKTWYACVTKKFSQVLYASVVRVHRPIITRYCGASQSIIVCVDSTPAKKTCSTI